MPPTTFVASTVSKNHEKFEDDNEEEEEEGNKISENVAPSPTTQTPTTPSADNGNSTGSSEYAGFPSYEEYLKDYEKKYGQTNEPSSTTNPPTTVDKNNGLSIEEQSPLNPLLPTEAPQTTSQQPQEPVPGPEDESSNPKNEADTTSKAENRPQESKEEDEFADLMSQLKNDFDLGLNSTSKASTTTTTTELPPIATKLLQELDGDSPTSTIEQKLADANEEDIEATKYSTPSIDEDIKEVVSTTTSPTDVFNNDNKEETETANAGEENKSESVYGFANYDEYMKDYFRKLENFYNSGNSSSGSVDFNNKPTEIPPEPSPVPTTPSTATTPSSPKEDSEEEQPKPPSFEGNVMEAPSDEQTSPQQQLPNDDDTPPQGITNDDDDGGIPTQKPPTSSHSSVTSAARPTTTPAFTMTKGKESEPTGAYTIFTTSPAPTTTNKGVTSQKPDLQTQTAMTEDTNTPTERPSVTSPVTAKAPPVTPQTLTSPEWMEIEILPKTDGVDIDEATTSAPTTTSKPASDSNKDNPQPPITRPNDVTTRSQTSPSDKYGTEETITQASMKATSSGAQATTPSTTTVTSRSSTTKSQESVVATSESLLYGEKQKNQDSSQGEQSPAPTPTTTTTEEQTSSLAPNEDAVFITESSDKTPSPPATTIQPESTLPIDNNPVQGPVETQPPPPEQYETTYYGFSSYEEYLSDFYKKMADAKQPQFVDTVLTPEPPSPEPGPAEDGPKEYEGIQGPAYPSAGPINPDTSGAPAVPSTTTTTTEPAELPQDTSIPTEAPTTTAWPWNDLNYDYRYLWETYSQVLQKWANKYMAPVEHHNVTVWPNSHPTMSPNRTGLQSEYETYLGNFEKWEAKNRPYVPTTPKTVPTLSENDMVNQEPSLPSTIPPETTPVPSVVLMDHFQQQQQQQQQPLPEVTSDKPENSKHTIE